MGKKCSQLNSVEDAWQTWLECIAGEDNQSIKEQVWSLVWDEGIFRMILICRQTTIEDNPLAAPINGPFHNFIDRIYSQAQFVAIRKVIGKDRESLYGEYGVFSIYALLRDIRDHRNELTRAKYFALRKVPIDIEQMKEKKIQYLHAHAKSGEFIIIPREYDETQTINAHKLFDLFSGRNNENRTPEDLISEEYLNFLHGNFESAMRIVKFTDKQIAHAATNNNAYKKSKVNISYKDIWQAVKIISETLNILGRFFQDAMYQVLPLESPDFFENWDAPLITSGKEGIIKKEFLNYRKETAGWTADII